MTAAAILKTREENQKQLTACDAGPLTSSSKENCRVVAVTAEKKVAIVERLSRLLEPCFWANRIVGTPVREERQVRTGFWHGA